MMMLVLPWSPRPSGHWVAEVPGAVHVRDGASVVVAEALYTPSLLEVPTVVGEVLTMCQPEVWQEQV